MATRGDSAGMNGGGGVLLLLRKDWSIFTLRHRIFVLTVFLMAALQAVVVDEAYFLLGVALAAALAVYVPVIEWYQGTDPMLHSLPVKRGTVVAARHVVTILGMATAGIVWNTTGRILRPILGGGGSDPAFWMTLEGGLTYSLAVAILALLFFPLYFRFGMGRGIAAFAVMTLVLLAVGYGTAQLAAGPAAPGAVGLITPSSVIGSRVDTLLASVGPAATVTVTLAGMAGAFGISIGLSRRWFATREF
ncbi:MAG: ABC-2 transporter permease [Gemmatimonadota bacterium]|nr:MAG: ABC-2 transporter permease [Gemmatimonadota bacterium]